jgi:hypothetical protein
MINGAHGILYSDSAATGRSWPSARDPVGGDGGSRESKTLILASCVLVSVRLG